MRTVFGKGTKVETKRTSDGPAWQRALRDLAMELRALYGPRLRQILLHGSRARGDAGHDSDVDVLVVLDPMGDFWEELSRVAPPADRASLAYDVVLSVIPVDAAELDHGKRPFLINVRREGVAVD